MICNTTPVLHCCPHSENGWWYDADWMYLQCMGWMVGACLTGQLVGLAYPDCFASSIFTNRHQFVRMKGRKQSGYARLVIRACMDARVADRCVQSSSLLYLGCRYTGVTMSLHALSLTKQPTCYIEPTYVPIHCLQTSLLPTIRIVFAGYSRTG